MKKQQTTTKQAPPEQMSGNRAAKRPVPSGQERMVTQAERDEVEALLQRQTGAKSAEVTRSEVGHEIV
jgi:hypothetical protein